MAQMNRDFEPKNEQGVIVTFVGICEEMGFGIEYIRSTYPDACLSDSYRNTKLFAEFEYHANNFYTHKHDPEKVDLIICWERGSRKFTVPILELSTLTSYPPNLYATNKHNQSNRDYGAYHQVLVSCEDDFHIYLYERKDGEEAYVIFTNGDGKGVGIEFEKNDSNEINKLIWKAVELSKISGKRGEDDPDLAKQARNLVLKSLALKSKSKIGL